VHGLLWTLVLWLTAWCPVRADDQRAKQLFDAGVAAGSADRWDEAASQLEASLREADKPATRYNLVLAYHELKRPIELARHALAFLREPGVGGREDARALAGELFDQAKRALAVLDVGALPTDATLSVDGQPPEVTNGPSIYVSPGGHVLEARFTQAAPERVELVLSAGESRPWPREASLAAHTLTVPMRAQAGNEPPVQPARAIDDDRFSIRLIRQRAARSMGVTGAALTVAGVACLWLTDERGDRLARGGIEGTEIRGYFDEVDRYWRSSRAVMPLGFAGGALMAAAVLTGNRARRTGSVAWSVASLVAGSLALGAGAYLLIRKPAQVIPDTEVDRPSRQAGSLLIGAASPMITYGFAYLGQRRREVRVGLSGVASLRLGW
jgi:hypothetical protein